ncbi:MAG: histidinol-phosphate aminotransferase family protein [Caldilineaceae bacterium SB0664_bin_22]|nr:histidinol-phosphate aminotransferase family protein [Caldilineaceae bacterium SB0664_bin_22]MYC62425.1 histidinol-phosphate aminotransferase family protein [Caldilineaceae bacterium SB0661_bin_34]
MTTVHGGLDATELRAFGLRPGDVLDFSSNLNPLGTAEAVRRAAASADLAAYPDRNSTILRDALTARLGVGADHLLVGNGSTELIHLLAHAILRPGDRCLLFAPTFGEYEAAALLAGADVHSIRAHARDAFRWPIDSALDSIQALRPDLTFLCNPNNPTGAYLDRETVERIRQAIGRDGLLVLDDAYATFLDQPWRTTPLIDSGNVAILRSMTKDHALAGARLGYLVASPDVCAAGRALQPAWSVNAIAQAAGVAALDNDAHVAAARDVVRDAKAYLCARLTAMGLSVTPSTANFLLVEVGDGARLRADLLRLGFAVRDCTSFGLPAHIRIAVRRRDECARLVDALQKVPGR